LADRYYRNGTVHWVKTLDLNNSDLADTDEQVTLTAVDETSLRPYPVGTVLVAMYGGFNQIGRTGLLRIPAAVNQAITAIQPRATKLQPEYLLATLNFRVDYWKTVASSSRKDPNITSQDVRAFPIAFPQLPEQRAIATALSDIDALLVKLDALVAKKRDLKVAAMQQLLTGQTRLPGFSGEWEVKRFGEVAVPRKDRIDPRKAGIQEFCIELEHIEQGTGCLAGNGSTGQESSLKSVFHANDVLFGKLRAYLRKYWLADQSGVCSTEIWVLVANRNLVAPVFLHQIVTLDSFIEAASTAYGTHMPRSDWNVVKNYEVVIPKLEEQTAIATILSDMDTELTALEARRDKTRAIKLGMMQELLTGRIRLV
jgi:type I restriction enzyme, S subunit